MSQDRERGRPRLTGAWREIVWTGLASMERPGRSGRSVKVVGDAAHFAWVAGRGPAEPHTEVADHGGGSQGVMVRLDVHKLSVRLAAVCAGEVIAEQTLVHDHDVVVAALDRWLGARVCQEAGPIGFGPHRAPLSAEINSVVVAPGLVPSRPRDRVKTISATRADWPACTPRDC